MELLLINKITKRENFYWAWEKLKFAYKGGDVLYDETEVARLEANLDTVIDSIINKIKKGEFELVALRPMGYPKADIKKGKNSTRQMFYISPVDQLVWIAVVNIIGGLLDKEMPFWSYGNRLYVPTFYVHDDNERQIKFGWYRNTSGYIYRKWNQSWPRFRKHIALTIKQFSKQQLNEEEEDEIKITERIEPLFNQLKCHYILKDFWHQSNLTGKVYWASIDFEKFYPRARKEVIKNNITTYLSEAGQDELFTRLINSLFDFKIDTTGWELNELKEIDLEKEQSDFNNIPTGLFVSGFLANVLLLDTDRAVHTEIVNRKNIAHFRFVDDHIILSDSFEDLVNWINWYREKLIESNTGATINIEKTEPKSLGKILAGEKAETGESSAEEDCKLDPLFPTPLMTQTLTKVSVINNTDFEMLSDEEKDRFIDDVEHLLLADFNEEELKKDTRLSFAATVLTRILPKRYYFDPEILRIEKKLIQESKKLNEFESKQVVLIQNKPYIKTLQKNITDLIIEKVALEQKLHGRHEKEFQKVIKLLTKVIYENYDKIRLWHRALEFCLSSGVKDGVQCVFNLLKKLKENEKASALSIGYIYSSSLNLLSALMFKGFRILKEADYTHIEKLRAKSFLEQVLTYNIVPDLFQQSDGKFYYGFSSNLFGRSKLAVAYSLSKEVTMFVKSKLPEGSDDLDRVFGNLKLKRKAALIWLFSKKLETKNGVPRFWLAAIRYIYDGFDPVLLLYPNHIPINFLERIPIPENIGWLIDVYESEEASFKSKQYVQTIIQEYLLNNHNLFRWVKYLNGLESELIVKSKKEVATYFDPRLSEWTSLEITLQIAELIRDSQSLALFTSEQERLYIHPANYEVPMEWTKSYRGLDWAEWESIIQENKINYTGTQKIHDKRYTPDEEDPYGVIDPMGNDDAALHGLGTLLVCLLSKNFNLPRYWNLAGHHKIWMSAILYKLHDVSISSLTKQILLSIFSKRNTETRLLRIFNVTPNYEFHEDTLVDPEPIDNIEQFIKLVTESQSILKKYRINVVRNEPRQLIPVSLKQLSKEYNPYEGDADEQSA